MDTPVELHKVLADMAVEWKPQLVAQIGDYNMRVAKVEGEHFWHAHDNTDELFMVLAGELRLGIRDDAGERVLTLTKGALYVVPQGIVHKPFAPEGAEILVLANKNLSRPVA